jgi:hypothetical protein
MKRPHRRQFVQLAASAAALPTMSRFAMAQAYPDGIRPSFIDGKLLPKLRVVGSDPVC